MDALDLKVLMPEVFKYWSTVLRFPIDDLRQRYFTSLAVHSGDNSEDILSYLGGLWDSLGKRSARQ